LSRLASMRRVAAATLALGLALAAATALASCGGGSDAKLLPGTTAQEITQNLESVRELAAEGECADAQDKAVQVSSQVDDLQGIDQKLKEALQAGAEKLNEVVLTCTEATTEEETEETLPTTTQTTPPAKPKKEKPGKEKHEEVEPAETEPAEPPEEPGPQGAPPKGKAKGHEGESEGGAEAPSGGIGPGGETGGGG
jgi:hypothetical protein